MPDVCSTIGHTKTRHSKQWQCKLTRHVPDVCSTIDIPRQDTTKQCKHVCSTCQLDSTCADVCSTIDIRQDKTLQAEAESIDSTCAGCVLHDPTYQDKTIQAVAVSIDSTCAVDVCSTIDIPRQDTPSSDSVNCRHVPDVCTLTRSTYQDTTLHCLAVTIDLTYAGSWCSHPIAHVEAIDTPLQWSVLSWYSIVVHGCVLHDRVTKTRHSKQ